VPATRSVALSTDYARDETFCAEKPLIGKVTYRVEARRVTLRFELGGLPRSAQVGVNWINNPVRGYVIASIRTTKSGTARQSTLRMFRGGEIYGQGLQIINQRTQALGELKPC
jgi:hypothetical protein